MVKDSIYTNFNINTNYFHRFKGYRKSIKQSFRSEAIIENVGL